MIVDSFHKTERSRALSRLHVSYYPVGVLEATDPTLFL